MAADRTIFRAIAMREEWIVAVSEDPHGLDGLITSGTYILDDPQLTLLPAFDDTHGKCPETSTGFALKPAHLPPILHSGTPVS